MNRWKEKEEQRKIRDEKVREWNGEGKEGYDMKRKLGKNGRR